MQVDLTSGPFAPILGRMGTLEHEVKTRIDSATRELLREEAQKLERSEAFIIRRALRAYFADDREEVTA